MKKKTQLFHSGYKLDPGGDSRRRGADAAEDTVHAYRLLCKPYIRKVRVKVKRLKEGKREEEKEQQLTERFLLGIG